MKLRACWILLGLEQAQDYDFALQCVTIWWMLFAYLPHPDPTPTIDLYNWICIQWFQTPRPIPPIPGGIKILGQTPFHTLHSLRPTFELGFQDNQHVSVQRFVEACSHFFISFIFMWVYSGRWLYSPEQNQTSPWERLAGAYGERILAWTRESKARWHGDMSLQLKWSLRPSPSLPMATCLVEHWPFRVVRVL